MDLAVSVRRTVVQDKFFMARMQFLFCLLYTSPSISKIRVRVPVNRHASEIQFPVN